MRLICPNCDAQYEVAEGAIPAEGRDVQCSNCGHAWFQAHPDALADAAEEAAVFDPEPQDEVTADPADATGDDVAVPEVVGAEAAEGEAAVADDPVADAAEPDDAADLPPASGQPIAELRRRIDESVLSVLREEAAFEARARARDLPRPLETQGDLGLDDLPPVAVSPAARQIAAEKVIEQEPAEPVIRAPKGRDLLPDIEEINSTLSPVTPGTDFGTPGPAMPVAAQRSFRAGFVLSVTLAVVLAVSYVAAPRLAAQMPALAGPLQAYAAAVDAARMVLDGAIQKVIGAIQG